MQLKAKHVKTPDVTGNLPQELRKSHWEARLRDLIEAHGEPKQLATDYTRVIIGRRDPIAARNRLFNILNQKASVETAADTVLKLEKALKK